MHGEGGGSEGVDEAFARRSVEGFGAFILGRNMFGPVRGEWPGPAATRAVGIANGANPIA
jgi:dihydrofolate reductase